MGVSTSKLMTIKGREVRLYYINRLAEELGRTPQTIRKWEVSGILPRPIFRDKSGKRMYSEEQIKVIVDCAERSNVRIGYSIANTNFSVRVYEALERVNKQYI